MNSIKSPYLSVIIPAYNEEKRIGASIDKAIDYLSKQPFTWNIFVVDDGSKDNTIKVVESYGNNIKILAQPKNMGKGAAVRRGMLDADGEIRLFTDADFSTPIYEIAKLLNKIQNGVDICIGSRALDRSLVKEHQPFYREFMGKTYNKFVQTLVFKGITDTQCGFKAFKKDAAIKVFSAAKIDGFSFDVEALFLAQRFGFKIDQCSVEWYNDDRSKVNPIVDSFNMFVELFKIRRLHK
jgi:dolichyl-phosphate beta-glucosyltransferase